MSAAGPSQSARPPGGERREATVGGDDSYAPNVADAIEMVAGAEPVAEAMPPREPRPPKPPREARPPREPREPRETREAREAREPREAVAAPPPAVEQQAPLSFTDTLPLPQVAAYEPPPPPPAAPPVARPVVPEIPPIALALPPGSDLVLVETSHHAPAPVVEEPSASRPKRVRPPKVVIADEPLEIIETRKESSPPAG